MVNIFLFTDPYLACYLNQPITLKIFNPQSIANTLSPVTMAIGGHTARYDLEEWDRGLSTDLYK